jgi:DNA-binding transcriptional LysR family regulator
MALPKSWKCEIKLEHLRYFLAVAESGSYSGAARLLGVEQPTPGRRIRDLEAFLGDVKLFEKRSSGYSLTKSGRVFKTEAEQIFLRLEQAVALVKQTSAGDVRDFCIGYSRSPTAEFRDIAVAAVQRSFPGLRINLHERNVAECIAQIIRWEMDCALTVKPFGKTPTVMFRPLITRLISCAVCKDHPAVKKGCMQVKQLNEERALIFSRTQAPQYLPDLHRRLKPHNVTLNVVQEYEAPDDLLIGVAGGDGIALLLESARKYSPKEVKWLPLNPPLSGVEIGVLHKLNPSDVVAQVVQTLIRATEPFR